MSHTQLFSQVGMIESSPVSFLMENNQNGSSNPNVGIPLQIGNGQNIQSLEFPTQGNLQIMDFAQGSNMQSETSSQVQFGPNLPVYGDHQGNENEAFESVGINENEPIARFLENGEMVKNDEKSANLIEFHQKSSIGDMLSGEQKDPRLTVSSGDIPGSPGVTGGVTPGPMGLTHGSMRQNFGVSGQPGSQNIPQNTYPMVPYAMQPTNLVQEISLSNLVLQMFNTQQGNFPQVENSVFPSQFSLARMINSGFLEGQQSPREFGTNVAQNAQFPTIPQIQMAPEHGTPAQSGSNNQGATDWATMDNTQLLGLIRMEGDEENESPEFSENTQGHFASTFVDPLSPISRSPRGGGEEESKKHEREVNSDNSDPLPKRQEVEVENMEINEDGGNFEGEPPPYYEGDTEMENFGFDPYFEWCEQLDNRLGTLENTMAQALPTIQAQVPEVEAKFFNFQQTMENTARDFSQNMQERHWENMAEMNATVQRENTNFDEKAKNLLTQMQNHVLKLVSEHVQAEIQGFKNSILEEAKNEAAKTFISMWEELKNSNCNKIFGEMKRMKERMDAENLGRQQFHFQEISNLMARVGGLEAKNPVTIVQTEGGKQVDFAPHFDAIRAEMNRNMDFISKNYALRLEVLEIFQKLKGVQDETKGQILEGVKKTESQIKIWAGQQFAHRDRILFPLEQQLKGMTLKEVEMAQNAPPPKEDSRVVADAKATPSPPINSDATQIDQSISTSTNNKSPQMAVSSTQTPNLQKEIVIQNFSRDGLTSNVPKRADYETFRGISEMQGIGVKVCMEDDEIVVGMHENKGNSGIESLLATMGQKNVPEISKGQRFSQPTPVVYILDDLDQPKSANAISQNATPPLVYCPNSSWTKAKWWHNPTNSGIKPGSNAHCEKCNCAGFCTRQRKLGKPPPSISTIHRQIDTRGTPK